MGRIVYTKKHTTSKIYQHEQKRIFGGFHFFPDNFNNIRPIIELVSLYMYYKLIRPL